MIATLRGLREELAAAIGSEIVTYDLLPAAPSPPFAVVMWPDNIEFSRTLAGHSEIDIPITVYVSLADSDGGQKAMDSYVSGGIRTALESHSTTVWKNITVGSVNNFRPEQLSETKCLAADFNLTLIA